jgi:hypothetical protein
MHCRARRIRDAASDQPPDPHAKERVAVPDRPGHRTRSPKDGLPRALNERSPDGGRISLAGQLGQGVGSQLATMK